MPNNIPQILHRVPTQTGVYQYFDKEGQLLYVGKAKNLKNRIQSYWRFKPNFHPNPHLHPRILRMLSQAVYLEYILVDREEDALILENSLIKELNPKYNVLLKDDKTYPYIYMDESEEFPRFELTRQVLKGKNICYYGPFPQGAKTLLDTLYELFPLVQKKSCLREGKACLFYQLKKCLAPCESKITAEEYAQIVKESKNAISNRKVLIEMLNNKMVNLAIAERFEEAGKLRENIKTIKKLTISSTLDLISKEDMDIFAILNNETKGVVLKLFVRSGKVISSSYSLFQPSKFMNKDELYKQALLEFYNDKLPKIPNTILVSEEFEERENLSQILRQRVSKKITIQYPKKGNKFKLIQMARNNASELLKNHTNKRK